MWKTSHIIPIPKKTHPKIPNDYRPVALTSIAMKSLERIIKTFLLKETEHQLDKWQFAYRAKKGVDDALLTILHNTYMHLDKTNAYVRLLFLDFSSAFNTIQPYLLLSKLKNMKVNSNLILWIDSFMLRRPQYVRVNESDSSVILTSTGAPQGCVISPNPIHTLHK